jgi:hypothetical protein
MSNIDENMSQCSNIALLHYEKKEKNKLSNFNVQLDNCSLIAQHQYNSSISLSKKFSKDKDSFSTFTLKSSKKDIDEMEDVSDVEDEKDDNSIKSVEEKHHNHVSFNHSVFNKKFN